MMQHHKRKKGFILIEIIIYVGLFALMMGGLLIVAYQLTFSTSELGTKVVTQEEINFVSKKIEWALADMSKINEPSSGISNTLEIEGGGLTKVVKFNKADGSIELCLASCSSSQNFQILNTKNITVNDLYFEKINHPSGGTEGVRIMLKINGITTYIEKYISIL